MKPLLLVASLIFAVSLGVGQLFFKLAAEDIKLRLSTSWLQAALSPWLISALFLYAFTTLLWIWILSQSALSKAYPFALLGAAFVPMLSYFVLGETLSVSFFIGMALVISGILVIQIL